MNNRIRQNTHVTSLVLMFMFALASCSSNNQPSKAPQSPSPKNSSSVDAGTTYVRSPIAWFEPTDFSTDTGATTPKLAIHSATTTPIDGATLDLLTKNISLVFWPELTAVDAVVAVEEVPTDDNQSKRYYVAAQPATALESRWHLIKLESPTQGIDLLNNALSVSLPDGSVGSRFNPGSELNLKDVRFCKEEDGAYTVAFNFSENFLVDGSYSGSLVQIAQDAVLDCTANEVPTADHPGKVIEYICKTFDKAKPVSLTFDQQIRSVKGESVKNLSWIGDKAKKTLTVEQGRVVEQVCLSFDMR